MANSWTLAMRPRTALAAITSSVLLGFAPVPSLPPLSSAQAAPTEITLTFDIQNLGTDDQINHSVLIWTQPSGRISTQLDTGPGTGIIGFGIGNPFDVKVEDFLRYAYYAIYEDYEYDSINDVFSLNGQSLLIGFNSTAAVGQDFQTLFQDFLSNHDVGEADLIDMLIAPDPYNHNPSLFDAFYDEIVAQRSDTHALIQTPLQTGETLHLIHFTSGQEVGTLDFTVVPEPASLSLMAIAGGLILSRRRA